jgi:hypothetical protein
MKKLSCVVTVLFLVGLFMAGCQTAGKGSARSGVINHVVVFWLKEPGNAGGRQKLIDASRELASLPGLLSVKVGTMVPSERSTVDSTYDVAIVMSFKNRQALADYIVHPKHRKAVEEVIKPIVSKILVYDFLEM